MTRARRCQHGCGAPVYRFTDEIGLDHQVDKVPLSTQASTTDPEVRHRVWRHRSKWVGWISVPYLGKETSHRPVHIEHDCALTPAHRRPCTCGDSTNHTVHVAHTKPITHTKPHARTSDDRRPFRWPWLHLGHQVR